MFTKYETNDNDKIKSDVYKSYYKRDCTLRTPRSRPECTFHSKLFLVEISNSKHKEQQEQLFTPNGALESK